ncbi:MAG: type II secretion system protein [Candidatus Brocadiia bacterium]
MMGIARQRAAPRGFTLIELLVVVMVLGLLMGILLPVVSAVRRQAWVTTAKHDLRQVGLACQQYHEDYERYPPARTFCASRMASLDEYNHLPDELVVDGYLPELPEDVFNPGQTYKYIAPGFGWANGMGTYLAIWVPRAFPGDGGPDDDVPYFDQPSSPVKFAAWSVGPSGAKTVFESDMLHYPVPPRHWYPDKGDGIIVYLMAEGGPRCSP